MQATTAHRRDLAILATALTRRVNRISMAADPVDIDRWWDQASPELIAIVAQGHDVAAALARRYLTGHAAIEGVDLDPVTIGANRREIATSLHVTGPVAFKTNMRISADPARARLVMSTALRGSAQRLTVAGDRATIVGTVQGSDQIAGWRRISSGSSCAFCAMLVSRGAVYSKASADFQSHDHCSCSPEPLYEREPEPEDVRRLQEQWAEATGGVTGAEKLKAWRQFQDAKAS